MLGNQLKTEPSISWNTESADPLNICLCTVLYSTAHQSSVFQLWYIACLPLLWDTCPTQFTSHPLPPLLGVPSVSTLLMSVQQAQLSGSLARKQGRNSETKKVPQPKSPR